MLQEEIGAKRPICFKGYRIGLQLNLTTIEFEDVTDKKRDKLWELGKSLIKIGKTIFFAPDNET